MLPAYIKRLLLPALLLQASTGFGAALTPERFHAGTDYIQLPSRVRSNPDVRQLYEKDAGKLQAIMFFSYGCYWCSQLNKPFANWSKHYASKVQIYQFPVVFNRRMWRPLASLYFTAHAFDPTGAMDEKIFSALHSKGERLWLPGPRKMFFKTHGLDPVVAEQTLASFSVNRQVKQADELSEAFEISATPNIIINGNQHSFATNLVMAHTSERLLEVLDFLVQRENPNLHSN